MFSMLRNVSLRPKHPSSPLGCPVQVLGSPPSVPHCSTGTELLPTWGETHGETPNTQTLKRGQILLIS